MRSRCQSLTRSPTAGSIASRVPEEHAPAGLAGKDLVVMLASGKVVPALRPHHHLAGRALVVDRLGHPRTLGLRDAIVRTQRALSRVGRGDLGAQRSTLCLDPFDSSIVTLRDLGSADTLRFERGSRLLQLSRSRGFGGIKAFRPFHGRQLFVFEFADRFF